MPEAGKQTYQIDIFKPKKNGEVTVTVALQGDAGGPKISVEAKVAVLKTDTPVEKAKKIVDALNAKINALNAANRGVAAGQPTVRFGENHVIALPIVIISNREGFKISKPKYDNGKTGEKAKGKKLAFLMSDDAKGKGGVLASLSAEGESLVIQMTGEPTGGSFRMGLDDELMVSIDTPAGQDMVALHENLAAALTEKGLRVSLATRPGDPDFADSFAGAELHLEGLEATEWMLDAADEGMGFAVMLQEAAAAKKA